MFERGFDKNLEIISISNEAGCPLEKDSSFLGLALAEG